MNYQKQNTTYCSSDFLNIEKDLFSIKGSIEFDTLAIRIFNLQYLSNPLYKKYIDLLGIIPKSVKSVVQIPFLPISFFKDNMILSGEFPHQKVFYSSGTTGMIPGKHYITNLELYRKSFTMGFKKFYGEPSDYCIIALLPGYSERSNSSLIYMVNELMKLSKHPENGFFLNEFDLLEKKLFNLENQNQKYILLGVTYALLDFAQKAKLKMHHGIIMETGGMKGKRKELLRGEVHQILKSNFSLTNIHSEYGMTELLSQAYSFGNGEYECPPWMKIQIRDVYDPFKYVKNKVSGGINIIDLANLYSCSFIETMDLGIKDENDRFEIIGRFDNSDIRGCNLLVD